MTSDQWLLLALRLAMALLLYLFLLWTVRSLSADLRRGAAPAQPATTSGMPEAWARLVLLDAASGGAAAGLALPVTAMTTVGRAGDNAVVLDDEFVSARHALLRRQNGAWWLSDAGSTNGTWANDHRVEQRPIVINNGDTVRFGRLRARFEA